MAESSKQSQEFECQARQSFNGWRVTLANSNLSQIPKLMPPKKYTVSTLESMSLQPTQPTQAAQPPQAAQPTQPTQPTQAPTRENPGKRNTGIGLNCNASG